jgi:hypothetical protein
MAGMRDVCFAPILRTGQRAASDKQRPSGDPVKKEGYILDSLW